MSNDKTGKPLKQGNSERDLEIRDQNYFRKLALFDDTVIAGAEMIGTGYDVFGKYCNVGSCINSLFDEQKVNASEDNFKKITILGKTLKVPRYVDCYSAGDLKYTNASGESIESYQSSISSKSRIKGNYIFFSASLGVDFATDSLTASENAFSRIQYTYGLYVLKGSAEALKEFLKESVKTALDKADTEEDMDDLFNTWGSHFLSGVVMGGCAQYSSSTDKYTSNLTNTLDVVAAASFAGFVGLSVSTENSLKEDIKKFRSASSTKTHSIGGNLSQFDPFGGATNAEQPSSEAIAAAKKAFDDWKFSVPSAPELVNFTDSKPLTGIWELCTTSVQKKKLKTYFETVWGPRESAKRQLHADYIDEIIISKAPIPENYILAGGCAYPGWLGGTNSLSTPYIYLCYHRVSFNSIIDNEQRHKCVSDMKVIAEEGIHSESEESEEGWIKIPQDINWGMGTKKIYLCYRQEEYNHEKAITDIITIYDSYPPVTLPPYGYQVVRGEQNSNGNVNEGWTTAWSVYIATTRGVDK
ncbi:hypothetical protein EAE91_15340 [Photorhabdus noenieputensis]|uniref:MAC/perforin domain-containing protein n=1 Tax=Photorhabdus noenieputensis TaxID=1208607 RepID=UPI001BD320AC|nr:MAC/perforin domain-containing protein [Photorhabdus noenieputensis]MBS9438467.1 hypothetical protein [Photorhabdus noenieputensis]MCK3671094.1 MACPF domain-containing protein [Photorhabdus noenieputensis]